MTWYSIRMKTITVSFSANYRDILKTSTWEEEKGPWEKHKKKGKLPVRERINLLLDSKDDWWELGALAAHEMYKEQKGAPSAGVVTGIGRVSGQLCMIVANDATVKAGAWFPMTGKKNLRAQEIAMENHLPLIYLVDSAGVFLPMQDEIFPDKEHFGRIFRNNAIISSMGIPQIAAIMGPCVAGGAYLPIMSDETLIVEGTGSVFLAGPYLVKSAIGEDVDIETLGGAEMHASISGVIDYKMPNDEACLEKIRSLVAKLGPKPKANFNRIDPKSPARDPKEILGILPDSRSKPYNMRDLLERIIDAGSWDEYKEDYGQSILCAYARVDGWAVGIVANQREVIKSAKGEMQFGGVIYSDSADKAARFVMNCNQKNIPLIFFQDVTGFMVGSRSEQGGIIKDGAKMVNAVSNSVVPKFTFIVGNSYGAGNYAMNGKAYDPRLIFAWPSAQIAVMGGSQAAKNPAPNSGICIKEEGKRDRSRGRETAFGGNYFKIQPSKLLHTMRQHGLWVDGIINPLDTRQLISIGIETANHNPEQKPFNPGVIQV